MKIVAIMPVRNEAWCLGLTARAALMWCDDVIVREQPAGPWNEMEHRQYLLDAARSEGATHIAIIDADELVTGTVLPRMRGLCEALALGWMLELPQINPSGNVDTMIAGGIWNNQNTAMVFRDEPAARWAASGDGYQHHGRAPQGVNWRALRGPAGIMHLQMLNERRLRAKQLLYCLNDTMRWPGRRTPEQTRLYYSWAVYGWQPPQALHGVNTIKQPTAPVPAEWWEPYRELLPNLKPDTEPWQLAECRRIVRENNGIMEGLDDFGVEL